MPAFAAAFGVAAFASLGLPGFSGFIAEFQIFTGALPAAPVATVIAVTGILITAALFLLALQRLLLGDLRTPDGPRPFTDLRPTETLAIVGLLALTTLIGILPRVLLDVVEPASAALVELVSR
jgi:NADH-quinone oxidoreductase subunit M